MSRITSILDQFWQAQESRAEAEFPYLISECLFSLPVFFLWNLRGGPIQRKRKLRPKEQELPPAPLNVGRSVPMCLSTC